MSLPPPPPSYIRRVLARDVRGYLLAAGGAGLVVCAGLFFRGGPLPAAITGVLMAAGLLLGWTAMPGTAVVAVAYLTVFPLGLPSGAYPVDDGRLTGFHAADLLFVPAMLCYLAAQFRLYSLAVRAHPPDRGPYRETKFGPPLRPAAGITDAEFQRLFAVVALLTLVGQLVWVGVVRVEPTFTAFPVRLAPSDEAVRLQPGLRVATPAAARFVMFAGLFAVALFAARFTFWYWRLNRLSPSEARVASTDTAWGEVRREMARIETWRAWGKRTKKPTPAKTPVPPVGDAPVLKRGPRWRFLFTVALAIFLGMIVPIWYILPMFN